MTWDPQLYARFADHRSRPFADLLARVRPQAEPRLVVDLGCGDGGATALLPRRWPTARVVGIDSSPQMLEAARAGDPGGRVEWVRAAAEEWDPAGLGAPIDVLVTNATLQWVPTHRELLPRWAAALAEGGWIALQVPHNFAAPSHVLMGEIAARHRRADELLPPLRRAAASATAADYLEILAACGLVPDAWTTIYEQVLPPAPAGASAGDRGTDRGGEHPVLTWIRSTGLRPVLGVLADDPRGREDFLRAYEDALEEAYPRTELGVVLPFERVFAVGHRADLRPTADPVGHAR